MYHVFPSSGDIMIMIMIMIGREGTDIEPVPGLEGDQEIANDHAHVPNLEMRRGNLVVDCQNFDLSLYKFMI